MGELHSVTTNIEYILFLGELISTPVTRNSMEQLSVAEDKLAAVMIRLLGVDIFNKKMEMDEERFVPEGLGYKTDLFEEEEKVSFPFILCKSAILSLTFGFLEKGRC